MAKYTQILFLILYCIPSGISAMDPLVQLVRNNQEYILGRLRQIRRNEQNNAYNWVEITALRKRLTKLSPEALELLGCCVGGPLPIELHGEILDYVPSEPRACALLSALYMTPVGGPIPPTIIAIPSTIGYSLSPSGTQIATDQHIITLQDGTQRNLPNGIRYRSVSWSLQERCLANTYANSKELWIYNIHEDNMTTIANTMAANERATKSSWSADGQRVAFLIRQENTKTATICIHDIQQRSMYRYVMPMHADDILNAYPSLQWHPQGTSIAADNVLGIIDILDPAKSTYTTINNNIEICAPGIRESAIASFCWGINGTQIIGSFTTHSPTGVAHIIRIWDTSTGKRLYDIPTSKKNASKNIRLTSDGRFIITFPRSLPCSYTEGEIHIYNTVTGELIATMDPQQIETALGNIQFSESCITFLPRNPLSHLGNQLHVWDYPARPNAPILTIMNMFFLQDVATRMDEQTGPVHIPWTIETMLSGLCEKLKTSYRFTFDKPRKSSDPELNKPPMLISDNPMKSSECQELSKSPKSTFDTFWKPSGIAVAAAFTITALVVLCKKVNKAT